MHPPPRSRFLSFGIVLLALSLGGGNAHADTGATARHVIDFQKSGIRFQIKASIKADPASSFAEQLYNRGLASLTVNIRISSHARESQFYGVISRNFLNFQVGAGSANELFWQDARCHQRRGLPKTMVVAIDGSIATAKGQISVHARPRQLGLLLPSDEITQEIRLPKRNDPDGPLIAFRSRTKRSHLLVDVKIYAFGCEVGAQGH